METPPSTPPQQRTSPNRFANIQSNVRNLLRASSVYPETNAGSVQNTPKPPRMPFLRRENRRISTDQPTISHPDLPSDFVPFRSQSIRTERRPPFVAETTQATPANHYPATTYSPASLPSSWNEHYEATPPVDQGGWMSRSPSLSRTPSFPSNQADADGEAILPAPATHHHRKKRRRRRKHNAWVKRKHRQSVHPRFVPMQEKKHKRKCMWCVGSGLFLGAMLTTYLTLALTVKTLNQSLHVMFILVILASTIIFCHSLIRLCVAALRPKEPPVVSYIPEFAGPEGFKPEQPIRVHLARDEEMNYDAMETVNLDNDNDNRPADATPNSSAAANSVVKQPPPAYGLWRCSVRVDPNLLHWQRVNAPEPVPTQPPAGSETPHTTALNALNGTQSQTEASSQPVPRPPSYASDDGVEYVTSAAPRSTINFNQPFPFAQRPPSQVHPAYRRV